MLPRRGRNQLIKICVLILSLYFIFGFKKGGLTPEDSEVEMIDSKQEQRKEDMKDSEKQEKDELINAQEDIKGFPSDKDLHAYKAFGMANDTKYLNYSMANNTKYGGKW